MPSKRIHNIMDYMTYEIYLYVQRGLFERHKIIFALMLANKILVSAGKIKAADLDVLLKGGAALDINSVRKKPKDWIPDNVWLNIIALSSMEAFRDIPDSVFRNDGLWRGWYDLEAPEMGKVRGQAAGGGGAEGRAGPSGGGGAEWRDVGRARAGRGADVASHGRGKGQGAGCARAHGGQVAGGRQAGLPGGLQAVMEGRLAVAL